MPTIMTTVGAPGLMNVVRAVFDRSIRIRCCHSLANIRAKFACGDRL
jgi:hypothetical protein